MKQTATFYFFYHNIKVEFIKLFVVCSLLFWILFLATKGQLPTIPLFILSWIFIFETFFHFSLARTLPKDTIWQNGLEMYDSFTMQALYTFVNKDSFKKDLHHLLLQKSVQFYLSKAGIDVKEIILQDVDAEQLAKKAIEIAQQTNGTYATTIDIFTAYLLLTEQQTKLLFSKALKFNDILAIAFWTKAVFSEEEKLRSVRVHFWGEGIGETMLSGWTLETKKYTLDLTPTVMQQGKVLAGREKEFQNLVESFAAARHKSLLFIGDPGSGRRAMIYSLAYESFLGDVPDKLKHKKLYQLLIDRLLAGSKDQGELEQRLEAIIEEVSHANNVLLYVPNFENLVGATTFGVNLMGTLLPYLENGSLQLIGSITIGNYKTYIEPIKSLENVFIPIKLVEPDKQEAMQMLLSQIALIEAQEKVFISYKAILKSINLAKKYMPDSVLPGAAVWLLEDTAEKVAASTAATIVNGRKNVTEADIENTIEQKSGIKVAPPDAKEKTALLTLEQTLHEHVVAQDEAVKVVAEAMRRVRSNIISQTKPISFLFLGPTGVGKTETAKTLAAVYFKGESNMLRFDMSEYTNEDGVKRLLGAAPGQGNERGELTDKIHDHPFSLVLLDEFEKADKRILDLFLQVLDDGRLTDNKGQTVSFVDSIIIATSNAGSELIRESVKKNIPLDSSFQEKLLDYLQQNGMFKPELLNRFDAVVVFKPLTPTDMQEVVKHMLEEITASMQEKDIRVNFDNKLIKKIVTEGINEQFGARPLRRYIQDNIEDVLAKMLLRDEVSRGNSVTLTVDDKNDITAVSS